MIAQLCLGVCLAERKLQRMRTLVIILELQGYGAWIYNHGLSLRNHCTCMLRELLPITSPDISTESWKMYACILHSSDVSPNAQHINDLITPVNTEAAGSSTQIHPILMLSSAEIVWGDRL